MPNKTYEIETVDEALEAIKALDAFMFKTQRNCCTRKDYIEICGSLNTVRWEIAKYCKDKNEIA